MGLNVLQVQFYNEKSNLGFSSPLTNIRYYVLYSQGLVFQSPIEGLTREPTYKFVKRAGHLLMFQMCELLLRDYLRPSTVEIFNYL